MKNIRINASIVVVSVIVIGIIIYLSYSLTKTREARREEIKLNQDNNIKTILTPASQNCITLGGTLSKEIKDDGTTYNICYLEDDRGCEEWALFNKNCPPTGIKTTGYDNIEDKFCAWNGGKVELNENNNSICNLPNGKSCNTVDFYKYGCKKS